MLIENLIGRPSENRRQEWTFLNGGKEMVRWDRLFVMSGFLLKGEDRWNKLITLNFITDFFFWGVKHEKYEEQTLVKKIFGPLRELFSIFTHLMIYDT